MPVLTPELNKYFEDIGQQIDDDGIQVSLATKHMNGDILTETLRINGLFVKEKFDQSDGNPIDNKCGVAYWEGTSFATAVATGIMAKLCLAGMTAKEAYCEMLKLPIKNGIPTLITWQELV